MVKIRKYKGSDYKVVVDLINEFNNYIAATDSRGHCRQFSNRDEATAYFDQGLKDVAEKEGIIYVAETAGKITGFVLGIIDRHNNDRLYTLSHHSRDHGWVGELYIKPEYRKQGIARELIETISTYFKANGCVNIRLLVMADNTLARDAYEKMGFDERDLELAKEL